MLKSQEKKIIYFPKYFQQNRYFFKKIQLFRKYKVYFQILEVLPVIFFLQGRFYLKNRQKPTATLIYTDNIIYNIYTTYIPPPPIINTFSDVKIHVSKVHVHQNSKR